MQWSFAMKNSVGRGGRGWIIILSQAASPLQYFKFNAEMNEFLEEFQGWPKLQLKSKSLNAKWVNHFLLLGSGTD